MGFPFSTRLDMPALPTGDKPPHSARDRDWRNGLLLIIAITGLPVLVAAVVAALVG